MSIIDTILDLLGRGLSVLKSLWRAFVSLFDISPSTPELDQSAKQSPPELPPVADDDHSDLNTIGRMLASEDRNPDIKAVIGWIGIQKAKASKRSIFDYVTSGKGFGPQDRRDRGQGIVYASTAKKATPSDLRIAAALLDGSLMPSAQIRAKRPGGWIERGTKIIADEKIINKQKEWNEGIYARIANSKWVLFSPQAPKVFPQSNQSATALLDSIPEVPALDDADQRKVA